MSIAPNSIINGDCLEVINPSQLLRLFNSNSGIIWDIDLSFSMKENRPPIVLTSQDIEEIKRLYEVELWGVRRIADHFNTNHHFIQRRINEYGIFSDIKRSKKPVSEEAKRKSGQTRRRLIAEGLYVPRKGYKMAKIALYKNMATHLKYDVSIEWLQGFEDIEKLKFLNKVISRHGQYFDTQSYVAFIERFYFDDQFNRIYQKWLSSDKNKWFMPSIDHIHPKCLGGDFDLSNLRFITWFENRTKADMSFEEWENIKANISDYFI